MANSNRWGDFKGALANIVASGKVYNTYTNSYAPRTVAGIRMGAGIAGQLGPAGTIAGMVAKGINDRGNDAQAFDAGQEAWSSMADQFSERPQMSGMGVDVPDVNSGVQSQMGSIRGGIAGMVQGGYGPYRGGYQFQQQPTTSGLPNRDMGYASLPNYGEAAPQQQQQQPMQATGGASGGMGSQMGGARGQSGGGVTGDAARGMFEGMTDATRFAPIVGYGRNLDRGN